MQIITHPANVDLIRNIDSVKDVHIIDINRIEIISNPYMERERWTGKWLVAGNEFYQYWDGVGQPPSWAIYFGFVKKEMVLNFMVMEPIRAIIFDSRIRRPRMAL